MNVLTKVEAAVMTAISARLDEADRARLFSQLASATVTKRENSGAGFFSYFEVTDKSQGKILQNTRDLYVGAEVKELQGSLGFILWLDDGYVNCLEGYTETAVSTVGIDLAALSFSIVET